MSRHPYRIWVFTEHRGATFLINFGLPLACRKMRARTRLQSWAADEVSQIGLSRLIEAFEAQANPVIPDVIVLSRFVQPDCDALLDFAQRKQIPVLFHLDDLLTEIPSDLGEKYSLIYTDGFRSRMNQLIERSDGILLSTPALMRKISSIHPHSRCMTLPGVCFLAQGGLGNLANLSQLRRARRRTLRRARITIGYMGSSSHRRDLQSIVPQLSELLRAHADVDFETLGIGVPGELVQAFGGRVRAYGSHVDYLAFLGSLYELGWDIGLAPLIRDDFNSTKTYTKFVEYTACEIATVGQDMEPYTRLPAGAISLADGAEWFHKVQELVVDRRVRRALLSQAKKFCSENLTPARVATQTLESMQRVGHRHSNSSCTQSALS